MPENPELSKTESAEAMISRIISEQKLRPAHRSHVTYTRSKLRLTCLCGWQSSLYEKDEGLLQVEEEYDKHLKLNESERYSN